MVLGISCLFPYIKKYSKVRNISEFSGQVAAVDDSCWIRKSLSVSIKHGQAFEVSSVRRSAICRIHSSSLFASFIPSRSVDIFYNYLTLLKNSEVVSNYVVFDGLELPK